MGTQEKLAKIVDLIEDAKRHSSIGEHKEAHAISLEAQALANILVNDITYLRDWINGIVKLFEFFK